MSAPVRLVRGRGLHMSINPKTSEVDILLRLSPTDLECRNALHRAMKHGLDLALGYQSERDGETYEAQRDRALLPDAPEAMG